MYQNCDGKIYEIIKKFLKNRKKQLKILILNFRKLSNFKNSGSLDIVKIKQQ